MMHREIQDHIEDMLGGGAPGGSAPAVSQQRVQEHLAGCTECRGEVRAMLEHSVRLRELRPPEGAVLEPRAGFYARVMERIESEGPISIWNLFIESAFGRRIAVASMALALVLSIYLISAERAEDEPVIAVQQEQVVTPDVPLPASLAVADEDLPGRIVIPPVMPADDSQSADDAILVNLVTYQEQ